MPPRPRLARSAVIALLVAAAAAPATASADWSAALAVPGSAGAGDASDVAVNGRGDLVVAWSRMDFAGSAVGLPSSSTVKLAVRRAGATSFSTRTLRVVRRRAASDVAVALDRRGEVTVAWIEAAGHDVQLRTAFRSASGRWSRMQTLAPSGYRPAGSLRMAPAPDGTVALTFATRHPRAVLKGAGAAWRSRGQRFGAVRRIAIDRALSQPALAVDPAGRFYLAGISRCAGVVFTATARGRRFGSGRTIAPSPVLELGLAVTGRGSAAVAWLAAACGSSEPFGGVPMAATLSGGTLGPPTRLGDPHGFDLDVAGSPQGAEASWLAAVAPEPVLRTAAIAPRAAPQTRADGWGAATADARGNQLATNATQPYDVIHRELAVRPADGGLPQPGPIGVSGAYWRTRVAAAADGAGLAAIDFQGLESRLRVAMWRPQAA